MSNLLCEINYIKMVQYIKSGRAFLKKNQLANLDSILTLIEHELDSAVSRRQKPSFGKRIIDMFTMKGDCGEKKIRSVV